MTPLTTPIYSPYYAGYLDRIDGHWQPALTAQANALARWPALIPADKADYAYAPGKWTVKQVLCHMADAERVFSYRALCIARGESQSLPGFDENRYVEQAPVAHRTAADLATELHLCRQNTLALLGGLPADYLTRVGTANQKPVSVEALFAISAGHLAHHTIVLRERYGLDLPLS